MTTLTTEMVSLARFSNMFPTAAKRAPIVAESEITYVEDTDSLFVEPTLKAIHPVGRATTLVLVEARAAMGKSTLARNLAHRTGGLYWDMSRIYLGHGTLWGRLAQTFGTASLADIMAPIMNGEMLLVLDALDEAELRSAGAGFDAFLEELKQLLVAPRRRPVAAVFGRPETIEYISLVLASALAPARYEIREFDAKAAVEFIDTRLDDESARRGTPARHRQYRQVFERARDLLLKVLEKSVVANIRDRGQFRIENISVDWRNERVRGFLGYAPVLQSVSGYLGTAGTGTGGNFYHRLINELTHILREPASAGGSHWDLLRTIVEELLDREQRKFVEQARAVLNAPDDARWDRLYDREEQLLRVLHRTAGATERVEQLPAGFSPELIGAYRQLLDTTLPNHPFLGTSSSFVNVVMRDFTYAWAMDHDDPAVANTVSRLVGDASYQVSPVLGRFYLSMRDLDDPVPSCRAEDVGLIYESLVAEYSVENRPFLIVSKGEHETTMVLGGSGASTGAMARILNPDDGVRFWHRLANARILGSIPVTLGIPGRSFTIGPNVEINAGLLDIGARHVRVSCRERDEIRIVAQDGYLSSSAAHLEPDVDVRGTGSFGVHWENIRFPWVQYAMDAPAEKDDSSLLVDFVLLCRVMSFLLKWRRVDKVVWRHTTTGPIKMWMGTSSRGKRLLEYLMSHNIIVRDGDVFFVEFAQLKARGIGSLELRERRMTPKLRELLEDFGTWASSR